MKESVLFFALINILIGCSKPIKTRDQLPEEQHASLLEKIAPYVIKKADEFTFEERFENKNLPFYKNVITLSDAEITYYYPTDTAVFFFFNARDLTSLYTHYRGLGGYYKTNENDNIVFVNLLFQTPRLTEDEMKVRGKQLFNEMIKKGNVETYLGNKSYIQVPNNDFYYNTTLNRWDYTKNSSWKFLEDAKKEVDASK